MKHLLLAALLTAACGSALGQNAPGAPAMVGQTPGGAINQGVYDGGNEKSGFADQSLTPALVVPSSSTAQAKFSAGGNVVSGTVIGTKTTIITGCSLTTGVTLPALTRFQNIVILNRSGGSCNVWPSLGATIETVPGTNGKADAPFVMPTNTNWNFRAKNATTWLQ
jgi:hypothetical protein